MRFFKQFIVGALLAGFLGSCYVSARPAYYTPRCGAGWYWDGYRCRVY